MQIADVFFTEMTNNMDNSVMYQRDIFERRWPLMLSFPKGDG